MIMDQETAAGLCRERAENLFATWRLFCSEAVVHTLNTGLGGKTPTQWAIRAASGFAEGMGGAGCVCGSLAGGVIALGLFLGRDRPGGPGAAKIAALSRELHDKFKQALGPPCCRVLSRKDKGKGKIDLDRCRASTGLGAQLAAEIIIREQPLVLQNLNLDFLGKRDGKLTSTLLKARELLRGKE